MRCERAPDIVRRAGYVAVYDAEYVILDAGCAQAVYVAGHGSVRAGSKRIYAHQVVYLRRAVQRYADQKAVLPEQFYQLVGQLERVGLN